MCKKCTFCTKELIKISGKKDSQSNKYLLTINNPKHKGLTHQRIKEILVRNFKTLNYFCLADEMGTCYHTHIFVYFGSRVRFSMIKKYFSEAHIDIAKGMVSENIHYVSKTGKWKDTEKSETCIEGTFEEFGKRPPDSKGKRSDMTELYHMVDEGMTNAEILSVNQDYILQIDKIDKLRTMLLTEKYKGIIRSELRCIYVFGKTGTGKTTGILNRHSARDTYRVTDYLHPFDGYNCQPVICFDEFRSSLYLKDMLHYCDVFPMELPARFSNKFACYNTIYIVSNWELEKQYSEMQKEDPESWKAFIRRIHEVHVYKSRDNIEIYNSVEEYMKRDNSFGEIEEDNPFN